MAVKIKDRPLSVVSITVDYYVGLLTGPSIKDWYSWAGPAYNTRPPDQRVSYFGTIFFTIHLVLVGLIARYGTAQ